MSFDWKWHLKDLNQDKPVNVFSIFSCGGGSSMGYKRAGFKVLGNCEIDPKINEVYVANNHPKYSFNMDARDFLKLCRAGKIPDELKALDILDGSPPCTSFSMAGKRDKTWGKQKKFAEGQKLQRLDDLFFTYLDIVEVLRPKVCIAENVSGLVIGNAKGYVREIIARFHELGYSVQIFKLNAAFMNVPQARERIFFIANNQGYKSLKLSFNEKPISFGEVRSKKQGTPTTPTTAMLIKEAKPGECFVGDVNMRLNKKNSCFTNQILWDNRVPNTVPAGGSHYRKCDATNLTVNDLRNIATFPQDYNFLSNLPRKAQFITGMSVPPNMMANIAKQVWLQWLK